MIIYLIRLSAGFARGFFEPLAFAVLYPESFTTYAVFNFLTLVICPIPGYLLLSRYTDMQEKKFTWIRPAFISVSLITCAIVYPIMLLNGNFTASLFCLFLLYLIGEIYLPLGSVILLNVTSVRVRALQTGLN